MASTSFNLSTSSYQGRYLKLTCSQTKNISGNKSTISWTLSSIGGTSNYYSTGPTTVKINGVQVYYLARKNWDSNVFPAKKGSVSGSIEVDHTSDGSKTITCSIKTAIYTTTLSTISDSWELESIPRQATISSAPNFNDEQNPTITYSNLAGNSVDSLQACISLDGSTDNISYRDIYKTGTSYTFNLTDAERNALRNACTGANSRSVIFYVKTIISGVTYYSTLTRTLSIINANPIFNSNNLSYQDTNSTITAITQNNQKIVQNKSTLQVNYTAASGLKGATITSYSFVVNGVTRTSSSAGGNVSFGTINSANDLTLSATVTDSRGNTTTATKTITMLAWNQPSAIVSLSRLNNYENTSYLTVDGSISSVDSKNTMTIQYRYKVSGGSYNSFANINDNVQQTFDLNNQNAYIFNVKVTDRFGGTFNQEYVLGAGKFPLFIDTEMNAVGINEFPNPGEALRVSGGKLVADNIYIGTAPVVESGSNANGNYTKWADGTMICTIRLNVTDQATTQTYGSLYLGIRTWEYPATFIETPTVSCSEFQWSTGASWGFVGNVYTGQCVLRGMDVVSRALGIGCKISATATGRWK